MFIKVAMNNGYDIIDRQSIFVEVYNSQGVRFEFPSDGHWNEAGHASVAERIKVSSLYESLIGK